MPEGGTIANAYYQLMPSMEGATGSITNAIMPEISAASNSGGKALGSGLLTKTKGALVGAGAAIVGALGVKEIASGVLSIGSEFESMKNTIVVGTGASGAALDDLCESAKAIATSVPASFEDAGDVVQDLNTRMGMVGEDLESTGERVIAVGKMMGESVDVSKLTGSFNAFGISNEEAASKMDYLFGVAQSTGIGFNDLTGILEKNAPALTNLGFSYEEAANMAGLLDKAGMDASGTMGKMSKALATLAEPGEDAAEAYRRVIGEIEGYIEAGDTAAAIDVASSVFGTRGAAQFVAAVQSGSVSMDELSDSALGASGSIMDTLDTTMEWPERWELVKNKAKEALEPLGGALMEGASRAMGALSDALDKIDPSVFDALGQAVGDVATDAIDAISAGIGWISDHSAEIGGFLSSVGDTLASLWSALEPLASLVGDALVNVALPALSDLLATIGPALEDIIGFVVDLAEGFGGAVDAVGGFVEDCGEKWGEFSQGAQDAFSALGETVGTAMDDIGSAASGAWEDVTSFASEQWGTLQQNAEAAFGLVRDTVAADMEDAQSIAGESGAALSSLLGGDFDGAAEHAGEAFATLRDNIGSKMEAAHSSAVDIANRIGDKLGFPGLGNKVDSVFGTIKENMSKPIEAAHNTIEGIVNTIKGFFSNFKVELPHINLPHFKINPDGWQIGDLLQGKIPSLGIDWYAKGGFVDEATVLAASSDRLSIAGERGVEFVWPKYEPYLSEYARAIADNMPDTGNGDIIRWLERNLPTIIATYTPYLSKHEFGRMARAAVMS